MSTTTFGRKALNDGKFVGRLRSGGRCWPETASRARNFIKNYEASAGDEQNCGSDTGGGA